MARVKNGVATKARRKKIIKAASGYFGSKNNVFKTAREQVMHSGQYAYRDRRQKKRDFRKLWITRINAACRLNDISYSKFISGLNKAGVEVNRKMLSEIAISDPKAFSKLVDLAKKGLDGKASPEKAEATKGVVVTAAKAEKKEAPKKEEKVEKEVEKKAPAKKAPAKKATTTKKEETKKPVAKKAPAKKTTAKKTTSTVKKASTKKTK